MPWQTVGLVSVGGALGALARYGVNVAVPYQPGGFAWATFLVNVSGCLLIGVLAVLSTETWQAPGWVRPFLGVGVLGGYTTFSTYVVDFTSSLTAPITALAYLFGTLVAAMAAAWGGATLARALSRVLTREKSRR